MTRTTTENQQKRFERGLWCVPGHDYLAQIPQEGLV